MARGENPVKASSKTRTSKTKQPNIADGLSLEEAEETMRQLKARIEKAKKLGQQKKKQVSQQAEADAEQEYQQQTNARDKSSSATRLAAQTRQDTSNSITRLRSTASRSRTGDDDAYSVNFDDVDDDFIADVRPTHTEDEQPPSPEAQTQGKRKKGVESDGQGDSTDEHPSPKTTAPAAKKRKGAGAAIVEVADAATPLPRKLALRKQAAAARTTTQAAEPSDGSANDDSSEDERIIGEHTPYKRKINESDEKKPRLKDLSPTSKTLAKNIRKDFTILISTLNAFPSDDAAGEMVDELFVETTATATEGSKIARRVERYAADNEYQTDIQLVGQNVDAGFRGRVVATAQPLVDQKYGFEDSESTSDTRKSDAAALVKQGAFAHRDWKTRKGYLLNPLIWRLLAKHFLAKRGKKRKALIQPGPDMAPFKEMRDELIAFLLTTIHCAIDGWSSGTFDKAEFSKTEYENKYKAHLSTIKTVVKGNPGYMAKVRKIIWDEACNLAGLSASIAVEEDQGGEVYLTAEELEILDDDA